MLGVIGLDCPWGLVLDCPWGLAPSEGLLETAPLLAMLLVTGLLCIWELNVAALLSLRGLLVGEVAGSSICNNRTAKSGKAAAAAAAELVDCQVGALKLVDQVETSSRGVTPQQVSLRTEGSCIQASLTSLRT